MSSPAFCMTLGSLPPGRGPGGTCSAVSCWDRATPPPLGVPSRQQLPTPGQGLLRSPASPAGLSRKPFSSFNANISIYFFFSITDAEILLIGISIACRLDLFLAIKKNHLVIKYNYYLIFLSLQSSKLLYTFRYCHLSPNKCQREIYPESYKPSHCLNFSKFSLHPCPYTYIIIACYIPICITLFYLILQNKHSSFCYIIFMIYFCLKNSE